MQNLVEKCPTVLEKLPQVLREGNFLTHTVDVMLEIGTASSIYCTGDAVTDTMIKDVVCIL